MELRVHVDPICIMYASTGLVSMSSQLKEPRQNSNWHARVSPGPETRTDHHAIRCPAGPNAVSYTVITFGMYHGTALQHHLRMSVETLTIHV